jgi:hypothetical protein
VLVHGSAPQTMAHFPQLPAHPPVRCQALSRCAPAAAKTSRARATPNSAAICCTTTSRDKKDSAVGAATVEDATGAVLALPAQGHTSRQPERAVSMLHAVYRQVTCT